MHAVIAGYLGMKSFKGDHKDLLSLAAKFGIPDSAQLSRTSAILAIEAEAKRVWEAKDPPPTVVYGGTGRLDVPSDSMDVDPLTPSMGMDAINAETNFLLANPNITPEEFGRRAAALLDTPGFDMRYVSMLKNAHLNCKARHPSQDGKKVMLVAKRLVEVEKIASAAEAMDQAMKQRDAAFRVYRKAAERVGFEIPDTGNLMETLDAALEHCDRIVADACSPDIIAMNAENQKMLDEFAALGLLDD